MFVETQYLIKLPNPGVPVPILSGGSIILLLIGSVIFNFVNIYK